jgi:hypothetical protein
MTMSAVRCGTAAGGLIAVTLLMGCARAQNASAPPGPLPPSDRGHSTVEVRNNTDVPVTAMVCPGERPPIHVSGCARPEQQRIVPGGVGTLYLPGTVYGGDPGGGLEVRGFGSRPRCTQLLGSPNSGDVAHVTVRGGTTARECHQ